MDEMRRMSATEILHTMRAGEVVRGAVVEGDLFVPPHEVFSGPVRVSDAEFRGRVVLQDAQFAAGTEFSRCTFRLGASFFNCTLADAHFNGSQFYGSAYFWRSRFAGPAHFDDVVVHVADVAQGSIDSGELNLCWARFTGPASLVRVRVHGPARFWRTVFEDDVTMDEALFANGVSFMGLETEVSVDLAALGGPPVFDALRRANLIRPDPEMSMGPGRTRFAQLAIPVGPGTPAETFAGALGRARIDAPLRQALHDALTDAAQPMFAPGKRASLCRMELGAPEKAEWRDVNMAACRLLGTNLRGVRLANVTWPRRRMLFGAVERNATADETDVHDAGAAADLRRLYRDLAANYEQQLDAAEAVRFRIADRELSRAELPAVARLLANCERQLSAYGTSPGLALFWLAAFVLAVFPALTIVLGQFDPTAGDLVHATLHDAAAAIVRSLETAAFLNDSGPRTSLPVRFLTGIERIVVAVQLGLFLLSLRRLAWREPS